MPLQRNKPELEPAAGDDEGDGDPVELFQRRLTAGIEATEANPGEGVRLLRKACEIYPWTGWAHAELGIAQDTSGDPASALLQLEKAILSMPDQHLWWQSLGVVLRRLGHDTEARIAQVISQWIAEEKAKRGEQ